MLFLESFQCCLGIGYAVEDLALQLFGSFGEREALFEYRLVSSLLAYPIIAATDVAQDTFLSSLSEGISSIFSLISNSSIIPITNPGWSTL